MFSFYSGNRMPDYWDILYYDDDIEYSGYRIVSGHSGGYLYSDTWMLSTPIEYVEEKDDSYIVYTASNSVYRLCKTCEGVRGIAAGIKDQLLMKGSVVESSMEELLELSEEEEV